MENNFYKTIKVDGLSHRVAALLYDNEKVCRYMIASFTSRQTLDQCLSTMQKGTCIDFENTYISTRKKGYTCNFARATDENTCDGVHAVIYSNGDRIIRVFPSENKVQKVYEWLCVNTQSAMLPEWKSYFFNQLMDMGLIDTCVGFDNTGKAPEILVMNKDITTELIRNLKAEGLKSRVISLPVENNAEIDVNMSFLDIIQKLIIPYIGEQKCQYNVGEEISDYLKLPLNSSLKADHLYPRQQVITQGILNSYKNGIDYSILNGGTGTGKTAMSIVLSYALIREVLNKKNGKIAVYLQGHLVDKWQRSFEDFLNANGIKHKFYVVNTFQDVKKIPKKSDGIDVILLPKDNVKRSYIVDHAVEKRFKSKDKLDIFRRYSKLSEKVFSSKSDIIFEEADSIKGLKYLSVVLEKKFEKKVVLYTPEYNNNGEVIGYKVVTTSKILKALKGVAGKTYNFRVSNLKELRELITKNFNDICNETIIKEYDPIDNRVVCPDCGSFIYDKAEYLFDEEKWDSNYYEKSSSVKETLRHCNGFIKADGTTLTQLEIDRIQRDVCKYKIVDRKQKQAYMDDEGNYLEGEELLKAKRDPRNITILLKICGEISYTAKDQIGYRCVDAAWYMKRLYGKNFIDVCLHDEAHLYAAESNQGLSFGYLCQLSKINIPLTGTLTGGKASDIFKILFRLCPKKMLSYGYGYNDESLFIQHFGRRKRETVNYEAKYNKSGRKVTKSWKEIPGISPMLYNIFLSNNMVSRKIEDLNIPLPTLKYYKHAIEMPPELKQNYNKLKNDMQRFMKEHKGVSLGGSYVHSLISYPDMPQQKEIMANVFGDDLLVAVPKFMELDKIILPKEQKLIDTIEKELKEGRRTLVYATYTGDKGVSKRLLEVLSRQFKVAELKGEKVKLKKREEWIQKQYDNGVQVIITNPECVATGLDIIQYPTIYFYEVTTNTKTLRQAEKRAYRPNFIYNECRIYYSFYRDSFQEELLKLQMGKKKSSLALEGVFSEDLLSSMAEGGESIESMLSKVLAGKMTLKENSLDNYDFADEEETEFTFKNVDDENVEVTKKVTTTDKVTMTKEEVSNLTLFTVDKEFRKKLHQRKSTAPLDGQIGFAF